MANKITVNTDTSQVTVQNPSANNVVQVNTPGPQGSPGEQGPQGPAGEIPTSGSYSGSFSGSFQGDGTLLTGVASPTGSYTGSFTGSVLGDVIGTASQAVTASYALFAVSASHEVTLELSSSFAETASVALRGEGDFTGSFLATGDILPDAHFAYDIGSSERAFRELYLSGSTIYLGGNKLSINEEGTLKVTNNESGEQTPSDLSGSFTGSYLGSVSTTDFTFDGDTLNVLGDVFVQGTLDAATKNFKIQHPTMPGYYLVHSSLEGPERGMYVRGKLKTSDTIHLPDYWNELTDDVDITVQLTPIGNSCTHFVKSVNKQEIIVGCDCGAPHCFYIVHAQRYNEGKFDVLQPKWTKKL